MKVALTEKGYSVCHGYAGREAVDRMLEGVVDYLVLDLRLPVLSGLAEEVGPPPDRRRSPFNPPVGGSFAGLQSARRDRKTTAGSAGVRHRRTG